MIFKKRVVDFIIVKLPEFLRAFRSARVWQTDSLHETTDGNN